MIHFNLEKWKLQKILPVFNCSCIISHLPPVLHWMFTTRKCQIHVDFYFANFRIHSIFVYIPVDLDFSHGGVWFTSKSSNQGTTKLANREDRVNAISHAAGIRWKVFSSLMSKYFFCRNVNISFAIMPSELKRGGDSRIWHQMKNDTMPAFSVWHGTSVTFALVDLR